MTRYNFKMNPRDFILMMPMDFVSSGDAVADGGSVESYRSSSGSENKRGQPNVSDNSKYVIMNHTTPNDLAFQYNMGFGNLVINDFRVKEFRIERSAYPPQNDFFGRDVPKSARQKRSAYPSAQHKS